MSSNSMEEYYQRVIQLQEKLRQSEEQRLQLEIKFNEMLQVMKEEEEAHCRKLRSKYKQFLEEDRLRQQRNDKILEALDRIENRTVMWEVKTEKFKAFRKRYHDYLKHAINKGPSVDETFLSNTQPNLHDYSSVHHTNEESKTESNGKEDILEKYLQSVSSQKCKDKILHDDIPPESRYSNLGNVNSIYWKNSRTTEKTDTEKFQPKTTKDFENSLKQNISTPAPRTYDYSALNARKYMNDDDYGRDYAHYDYHPENYDDKLDYTLYRKEEVEKSSKQLMEEQPEETPLLKKNDHEVVRDNWKKLMEKSQDDARQQTISAKNTLSKIDYQQQPSQNILRQHNHDDSLQKSTPQSLQHASHKEFTPNTMLQTDIPEHQQSSTEIIHDSIQPVQRRPSVTVLPTNKPLQTTNFEDVVQPQPLQRRSSTIKSVTMPLPNEPIPQRRPSVVIASTEPLPVSSPTGQPLRRRPSLVETIKPVHDNSSSRPQNELKEVEQMPPQKFEQLVEEQNEVESKQHADMDTVSTQPLNTNIEQIDVPEVEISHSTEQSYGVNEQQQPECNIQQYDDNQYYQQYYDENGQPLQQQYDEQGQPLMQYDHTTGQYYDENGQPIQGFTGTEQPESQYYQQYNETGQPLQGYDENGQPVIQYDQNGQYQYDVSGQPLIQYDENGQPVPQYDDNEQLVQYDQTGQPITQYDQNEQSIVQYDQQPLPRYDENEESIPQCDQSGQSIPQYDQSGQSVPQYDRSGQPVPQYDQNEQQRVDQYNQNDQPVNTQYDDRDQPIIQYNKNEPPFQQHFDENGQSVQYYPQEQYDENGQPIHQQSYADEQAYYEQPKEQNEKDRNKTKLMEMLDTDTESAKQDTTKISNDSDFELSTN